MDALRGKFGLNLKIRAGSAALKEVLTDIDIFCYYIFYSN
jgi:hypothetical protein